MTPVLSPKLVNDPMSGSHARGPSKEGTVSDQRAASASTVTVQQRARSLCVANDQTTQESQHDIHD